MNACRVDNAQQKSDGVASTLMMKVYSKQPTNQHLTLDMNRSAISGARYICVVLLNQQQTFLEDTIQSWKLRNK